MVVLSEHLEGSSSSSSTPGCSSSTRSQSSSTHDVFLSFRGLDTRLSFTNYLYEALKDANISTFLDDEEIETGEDLKPELENAIKSSRASIIVLSKNYASSTWCLDELVLILEQRMASSHIVIPIFYHVEPTHVRKQQGSFGDAMAKHKKTMEEETNENKRTQWARKMDKWNKALTQVADLKGKNVNGRLETKFIEEILEDIYHRLPLRSVEPQLIGMVSSINFITSWLKDTSSHRADILSIVGMGGIGKTSLAKYVYELHCREFHRSSFIEDISRRSDEKFNGLLDLQRQLCNGLLKTSSIEIHNVSQYTSKIENALARKRVFLVLDDITSLAQLDALLGSKGFHLGSKIIITTRDTSLTERCALFKTNIKPKHTKHILDGLNQTESRQLLCFHAFMSKYPNAGYEDVSHKLVMYCQGHPLALVVLGNSLHNRDVAYWEGCIEGLKKGTGSPINDVLKMSFDSLQYDKELFKHIACFFVGTDRDVAETILKACDINTKSGITNLIDRFLLSIGCKNELKMHQLVQEMGRFEVRQESVDKPWKRSRLWCHEDSFRVLKRKKGKGNILGLALDMRMLEKKKLGASCELKTDALSNMENLMLLQLNYVHMNESYENFPDELRALCMWGFRLKSIPLDLPMENLVALDLSYSSIESFIRQKLDESCFKQKRLFGSLKILNLSFCKQLRSLGDFDQLHALERLILRNCIGLVKVCESIEQCVELVLVDLSYCNKIESLPKIIGMLKNVKTMLLDGCNLGESRIEIRDMDSPEMCKPNNIDIDTRLSTSVSVGAIPCAWKFSAINLPSSLVKLSLANNNLFTESFPMDFSSLSMLTHLCLDQNPINSLPNCVRTLPRIKTLSMERCRSLKIVEQPPHTLTTLLLWPINKIVFNPEMSLRELRFMSLGSANWSYEIEGMMKIQPMVAVEEKVLCSLGWPNFNFFREKRMGINSDSREWEVQMFYQFGIFSTMYIQEEMPNWFRHRSAGPSISFTIPSSPNNLRGLNFCYVFKIQSPEKNFRFDEHRSVFTLITFNNITKSRMWIYEHHMSKYTGKKYPKSYVSLSHWMFGLNEMERGDSVTIIVTEGRFDRLKECGVSFVYDDGNREEEDALGYYKLHFFQTTGGPNERRWLKNLQIFRHHYWGLIPYYHRIVGDDADYQEQKEPWFKAFPRSTPNIIVHLVEVMDEESSRHHSRHTICW